MARATELGAISGGEVVRRKAIGDEAVVIGYGGWPTLWWRNGDVLGVASGDDLKGLTAFALRVDAKLEEGT